MAKSAKVRHHNDRLYKKAIREIKLAGEHHKLPLLHPWSVFKTDFWDCGYTQCEYCHPEKVCSPKAFRLESRKLEQELRKSI